MDDKNRSHMQQDNSTWMVVYITHDMQDATIVAGRLKHEGIMAILDHMTGRDAIGITLGNWGEVKVLVHPQEYEMALEILDPGSAYELPEGDNGDILYMDPWDDDDNIDEE